MVDDVKSLTKKCIDLEKRLKIAEAKIKVVADSMTSAKDIEKYLDILQTKIGKDLNKNIEVSEKAQIRAMAVSEKAAEARYNELEKEDRQRQKEYEKNRKEAEKFQKEGNKMRKEVEKMNKEAIRQNEFNMIMGRISTIEALVAGIRR